MHCRMARDTGRPSDSGLHEIRIRAWQAAVLGPPVTHVLEFQSVEQPTGIVRKRAPKLANFSQLPRVRDKVG